jgi:hypothetical protein
MHRILPLVVSLSTFVACSDGQISSGAGGGSSGSAGASSGGASPGGASSGGASATGGTSAGGTSAGGASAGGASATGGAAGSTIPIEVVEPGDPGSADVAFTIRVDQDVRPISRLIYGTNGSADFEGEHKGFGLLRAGGNRWTAYNWETNASNAGSDWQYSNDGYLSSSSVPGEAVRVPAKNALDHGAAMMVTVPIAGYVSADKSGPVDPKVLPQNSPHFHKLVAKKNAPFSKSPDLGDKTVYADELVNWVKQTFPAAFQSDPASVLFSLDNEPDLWKETHPEIHPAPVTYAELVQKSTEFGQAIKDVAPNALVLGFVSYGFNGFVTLQNAPDASSHGNFIEHYLKQMKLAEQAAGKRLIDVLDLHWYSEVYANGQRIIGNDTSPASVAARVQAPRSLWDASYDEGSWINGYLGGPIALIPSVRAKIEQHYPGTTIGITEYNYGATAHISGAIAQADALGIFGREGVHVANYWPLSGSSSMVYAATRLFTSYDGGAGRFGDTSIRAATSNVEKASVYASYDAANPSRMVVIAINKSTSTLTAGVSLAAYASYTAADVYRLAGGSPTITAEPELQTTATNALLLTMPPLSISVLVPR